MPAPPSVVGRTGDDIDERDRSTVEEIEVAENAGSPGTDELRPDPAKSVVAIGDTPALTTPKRPRRLVLPPMPTDRARGWAVTADPDRDRCRRQTGRTRRPDRRRHTAVRREVLRHPGSRKCCATAGSRTTRRFGVVVHPPFGKQLIAIGEWLFGYTPFGWRFASAVAGIVSVLLIIRVVRQDDQVDPARWDRRRAADLRRRQPRPIPLGAAGHLPGRVRAGRLRLRDRRPGPGPGPAGGRGGGRFDRHPQGRASRWAPGGGGSGPACCSA